MQFHVLQELRQNVGSVNEFELAEETVRVDDSTLRDLSGTVSFLRTDGGLLATVSATAKLDETCSRCLTDIQTEIDIHFVEEYVPLIDADTNVRIYLADDDERFRIKTDFWLDLREGLRQYMLLNEPLKPLCREDCAGLCPVCGANLNEGPCRCGPETDDRWDVLAGLKKDLDEGN